MNISEATKADVDNAHAQVEYLLHRLDGLSDSEIRDLAEKGAASPVFQKRAPSSVSAPSEATR